MEEIKIRQLINRFLDGETTNAEEQMLYDYFAGEDIAPELMQYRDMFRWYSAHVKTCIGKYVSFSGKASRSEFWSWTLFVAVVSGVLFGMVAMLVAIRSAVGPDTASNPLNWLNSIIFPIFVLLGLFLLFCLLPSLAVTIRRLRDAGYRPWIIIFPILLLIGSYYPALIVALSGMDSTPPEIPLPYCYAYLIFTVAVCLLYVVLLNRKSKVGS